MSEKIKLIADSGSTKTEWRGDDGCSCITGGINPFYLDTDEIIAMLEREFAQDKTRVSSVVFYGAGALPHKKQTVIEALQRFFGIEDVTVETDLLGAARALCGHSTGIACILGTGSNSCLYNGAEIVHNVPPLGFILGDEGSGAWLGRRLLADLLRGMLPPEVSDEFEAKYRTSKEEIQENVYRKALPNRYMAGFTRFIAEHVEQPEIAALVDEGFAAFINRNILLYPDADKLPIHFTGSIAYVFRANLEQAMLNRDLKLSSVTKSPMEGMAAFHSIKN